MYLLSIDGGGTKTNFLLSDANGKELASIKDAGFDLREIGYQCFKDRILKNISLLNVDISDILGVCVGVPCYGEIEENDNIARDIIYNIFSDSIIVNIVNDVELGMYGALGLKKGIHIVCGTGSMTMAENSDGSIIRCGGYSELFSDEGSGYWLGIKALQLYSMQCDERIARDRFFSIVNKNRNVNNIFELLNTFEAEKSRAYIASFQNELLEAARENCESAIKILKSGSTELYKMVAQIYSKINSNDKILISYSGGVIENNEFIQKYLYEFCKENSNLEIIKPLYTPMYGGILKLLQQGR